MTKNKKKILLWLIAFFVALFLFEIYLPKSFVNGEKVYYSLEKGSGYEEIAGELERRGIIKNAQFFKFYAVVSLNYSKLQAGKYELSSLMSIADIAEKFAKGDIVKNKITIIEGWSVKDLAEYVENNGYYSSEEFINATKIDFSEDSPFLK